MPILDCSVKSCYYNKSHACCLEGIDVDGHEDNTPNSAACASFKEITDQATNSVSEDMNPQPIVNIDCGAKQCDFNEDCKCSADHIKIAGDGAQHYTETECSSFYCEGC